MKKKAFGFLKNYVFSAAGLILMTGITSLVVYPFIERELGIEAQGGVLFYMALAGLFASVFGTGANYARMKHYAEEGTSVNGDYNLYLLISILPTVLFTVAAVLLKQDTAGVSTVWLIVIALLMIARHYLDVEYRLKMNFARFFFYYTFIGIGYLIGVVLFKFLIPSWVVIFIAGELAGILFVIASGTVARPPFFKRSEHFSKHLKSTAGISASFFLSDFVGSADRFLFPILLTNGDTLTSLYYYASLVGKAMSLLSSPLNGVLSGTLANEKGKLAKKRFVQIILLMLAVWVVVTLLAMGGSHLFVWLFYPAHYEAARPYFLLANAGQVLYFICNTMMVIVLRYMKVRVQILTSVIYSIFFLVVTIPMILYLGIVGMAVGILLANALKFAFYCVFGLRSVAKEAENEAQNS
ncbi:MAG: hypothetical protein J5794_02415 [Lachnospiraceae bacterium]|nr:hypothetical protein [Lachnospiraceae bacterium]